MKIIKLVVTTLFFVMLAACAQPERFSDLSQYVEEVKSRPGGEVEPVPTFEAYEAFTYSAAGLRAPFDVPIAIQLQEAMIASRNVRPDLDRGREPLEDFAMAELHMVGMMERNGLRVALVEDSAGVVHRIQRGNYLGKNHGRVTSISNSQMDLVEIVPSGSGGWVERPQTLPLVPQTELAQDNQNSDAAL